MVVLACFDASEEGKKGISLFVKIEKRSLINCSLFSLSLSLIFAWRDFVIVAFGGIEQSSWDLVSKKLDLF